MMRLLSWNVQWCRGIDGRIDPGRIAAEAKRLADPDVVCLQEVAAGFYDAGDQFELLRALFPGYGAFAVWPVEREGKRFGNMLLSRLPVARVLRHSLPWPPAPGSPSMPRAALEAVIEAPFGPLRVLTTHLEYYSAEHRAAQVGRLRAIHAEALAERQAHDRPGPFQADPLPPDALWCGDFNFRPDDPLHGRILSGGFADAWQALHPGKPHPHSFHVHERGPGKEPYCCDFAFVSTGLAPRLRAMRVDQANQASDHQPVILELG